MISTKPPRGDTAYDLAFDLTPMLDVLFVLLVFFMLTMGSVFSSLDLTLPSVDASGALSPSEHVFLEIGSDGYALNGQRAHTFDELQDRLLAVVRANPSQSFVVAGDKDISIERLLSVLSYLRKQGVNDFSIVMEQKL